MIDHIRPSVRPTLLVRRRGFSRIELLSTLFVLSLAGLYGLRFLVNSKNTYTSEYRAICLNNLKLIGEGLQTYLDENGNRWPYVAKLSSVELHNPAWPILPTVLRPYLKNAEVFHCPADRRELAADSPLLKSRPRETTYFETEGTSYEWYWGQAYGGKKVGEESLTRAKGFGMGRADSPLLADFEPFHKGDNQGSLNTLNADLKPRTTRATNK